MIYPVKLAKIINLIKKKIINTIEIIKKILYKIKSPEILEEIFSNYNATNLENSNNLFNSKLNIIIRDEQEQNQKLIIKKMHIDKLISKLLDDELIKINDQDKKYNQLFSNVNFGGMSSFNISSNKPNPFNKHIQTHTKLQEYTNKLNSSYKENILSQHFTEQQLLLQQQLLKLRNDNKNLQNSNTNIKIEKDNLIKQIEQIELKILNVQNDKNIFEQENIKLQEQIKTLHEKNINTNPNIIGNSNQYEMNLLVDFFTNCFSHLSSCIDYIKYTKFIEDKSKLDENYIGGIRNKIG